MVSQIVISNHQKASTLEVLARKGHRKWGPPLARDDPQLSHRPECYGTLQAGESLSMGGAPTITSSL